MVAIIRNSVVPAALNRGRPKSNYIPVWPTARGVSYQGRVPYLGKRTWIAMRCHYRLPSFNVRFVENLRVQNNSFNTILAVVLSVFDLKRVDLLSHRKCKALAAPRQALCLLLKQYTTKSLPEIGRCIDRDHTTVIHALRRATYLCARDGDYREKLDECRARLKYLTEGAD